MIFEGVMDPGILVDLDDFLACGQFCAIGLAQQMGANQGGLIHDRECPGVAI